MIHLAVCAVRDSLGGSRTGWIGHASTFNFSGACQDCFGGHGNATPSLTVSGYTPGSTFTLTSSNFVSLVYDGTDMIPGGFTINQGNVTSGSVSGSLGPSFPGSFQVSVGSLSLGRIFTTETSGNWAVSPYGGGVDDQGLTSQYNLATSGVPEPASIGLAYAGMLAIAIRKRWVCS